MIKINNVVLNSPDYILTEVGDIKTATKRIVENTEIYGANGSYLVTDEGYSSSERALKFSVSTFEKITNLRTVIQELENVIEFDYAPNSKFFADLLDFTYSRQGQSRWEVTINLVFDPFRYDLDSGLTTLVTGGTIFNKGNVFSEPIIEVEGNGEVQITIKNQTMVLNVDTKAKIDCRHKKQNVYDKYGNVRNSIRVRGGFFEIQPGRSGVAISGNVTSVKIWGNWRYIV